MDVLTVQSFPFKVEELLKVKDLLLELRHHLRVHPVELDWLDLHDNLDRQVGTCLALYTNFRVFRVYSRLDLEGEMFPIMNV